MKKICMLLLLMICEGFFTGAWAIDSRINLQLRMNPPVKTIKLDDAPEEMTLVARVSVEGVRFKWKLEGPGRLQGDMRSRKVWYLPPAQIDGKTAGVTVSVNATTPRGASEREELTFTLHAAANVPAPDHTPNASHPSDKIAQLLETADAYMKRTFYTEPPGHNAFDVYRVVLELDPANAHAREQIRKIATDYRKWGRMAYDQKDSQKAQTYYQRYIAVGTYIQRTLHDMSQADELQRARERLESLKGSQRIVPTPTPSPRPSVMPTATATIPMPAPGPTPIPTAIPTVTPTPTELERKLQQAEYYLDSNRITTPVGESAFDVCKDILRSYPENQRVKGILQQILDTYAAWGSTAYQNGANSKALIYYERYDRVADYTLETFGAQAIDSPQVQEIRQRIETLSRPKPQKTPGNGESRQTASWSPQCATGQKDLTDVQQSFPKLLQQYKYLKEQEKQGMADKEDVIVTIRSIICDLIVIENILAQNYREYGDEQILKRLEKTKATRQQYEEELLDRLGH